MNHDFRAAVRRATHAIQHAVTAGEVNMAPPGNAAPAAGIGARPLERVRQPLGEALRALREGRLRTGAIGPLPGMSLPGMKRKIQPPPIPDGARFLTRSFTCTAGTRAYRLYIPAMTDRPRGLIVMLHGCRQDPDDFATGTNMNAVAGAHGLLVAYPAQTGAANAASCWNWFNPADQMRDAGEPSIIAGITREIMAEFRIDGRHCFVAGLSAGGAMAAVMAETYPDLYAAVGIHSGLAYKSAADVASAFAAMRGDAGPAFAPNTGDGSASGLRVRTIVFQGNADQTVHASNAARIVRAASGKVSGGTVLREQGSSAGGRTYSRMVLTEPDGIPAVECWLVDGGGHAWSGGHPGGSYSDPQGPDASAAMARFFLAGRQR